MYEADGAARDVVVQAARHSATTAIDARDARRRVGAPGVMALPSLSDAERHWDGGWVGGEK